MARGFSHVGYYTNHLEQTLDFYGRVLGFELARYDLTKVEEGGEVRVLIFDVGGDDHLTFLAPEGVEGIVLPPDNGISITHHVAFELLNRDRLVEMRDRLVEEGIEVSCVVEIDWTQSIFCDDPVNGLRLEFCAQVSEVVNSAEPTERFSIRASQLQEPSAHRNTYLPLETGAAT
jgi:catechol 2,3-dioxygenase-like lactoylglutathione lyase family enzyme